MANITTMDSTVPCEKNILLQKAYKKIADLAEDIRRLLEDLQRTILLPSRFTTHLPLLSSFMVSKQSKKLASNGPALQDIVVWDPSNRAQPSSCSMPNHEMPRNKGVICTRKRNLARPASSPRLTLSDRYAALSSDEMKTQCSRLMLLHQRLHLVQVWNRIQCLLTLHLSLHWRLTVLRWLANPQQNLSDSHLCLRPPLPGAGS